MIFLIVSLLREYNYNVNEDNCTQFIKELIYKLDTEQMEQVKKIEELIREDREKNFDDGFGR